MRDLRQIALAVLLAAVAPALPAQDGCDAAGGVDFICGPQNAEDLVLVPETQWILASGMAAGGSFYRLDAASGEWSALGFTARHDAMRFPFCAAPPPAAELESHGLTIRRGDAGTATLYAVGHGSREAIEVFAVGTGAGGPELTWVGCVPMPDGLAANSVASLPDGSIVATVLLKPGRSFADSVAMRPTGAVLKWSPGDTGFTELAGSELPGNNGIEVAADGSEIYVVSSGFQRIVAYTNTNPVRELRRTEQLPITPDNLHRGPDGRLLTAGMKNDVPECGGPPGPEHDLQRLSTCPRGAIAIAIDPATMAYEVLGETPSLAEFSNATMVLPAAGRYWFGTFNGNRIANIPAR